MLKISGGKSVGRPPLFTGNDEPVDEAPVEEPSPVPDEMSEADYAAEPSNLLPQMMVVYMTSDKGPFECGNCCYFTDNGECQKVQGPIDPHGCCNLYCPPNHDQEPMPEEESPAEDLAEGGEETENAGPSY